jgi:hypothetical protein
MEYIFHSIHVYFIMVVSMLFDVDSNINMLCCMDYIYIVYKFGDMVLNATFNNISVKSWQLVL